MTLQAIRRGPPFIRKDTSRRLPCRGGNASFQRHGSSPNRAFGIAYASLIVLTAILPVFLLTSVSYSTN